MFILKTIIDFSYDPFFDVRNDLNLKGQCRYFDQGVQR